MKDNSHNKSLVGGLVWKLAERFLTQSASLVISIILTRLLSPGDYGVIALVEVFTDLCYVVFFVGLASGLIQDKNASDEDFSTIFYCSLAVSLVIYGILFAIAPWFAEFYSMPILKQVLRVFALQIPLSVYNSVQSAYVSRHGLFRKLFISSFISVVVSGCVGIAMAWAGLGVWALVAQLVLVTIINSIVLTFLIPWRLKLCFRPGSARRLLGYSVRIMGAELSNSVFVHLRSLCVGRVFSGEALAYYQKAMVFPNLLTANVSNSIIAVVFPSFSDIHEDHPRLRDMVSRSSRLLSFVMLPLLFGLGAVMEPLVLTLYTDTWRACIPYAQVLCLAMACSVPGIIPLQAMKAMGLSRQVLKMELLKKPLYILLLVMGLRRDVLTLAALMALYELINAAVNVVILKKYLDCSIREQIRPFLSALAASLIMAVCVVYVDIGGGLLLSLLLKIAVGIVVYVLAAMLFRLRAFLEVKDMVLEVLKKRK